MAEPERGACRPGLEGHGHTHPSGDLAPLSSALTGLSLLLQSGFVISEVACFLMTRHHMLSR